MSLLQGFTVSGKRKRSASELEDLENLPGPSCRADHQRKRMRDSPDPSSPPHTPTPLSPRNCFDSSIDCNTKQQRWPFEPQCNTQRGLASTISWLSRSGLVSMMSDKEMSTKICSDYFSRHPNLQPRMRAVLLDWLIEVSDAYKMLRETFYLAVNYLDRYLSVTTDVAKTQLQLIGITSLFIAAKVEEIYPPKVHEFAYVTNEACTTEGILNQELLILEKLEWNLGALTVNGWLNLLLQIWHNRDATPKNIIFPNHPVKDYLMSAQLIDLFTLDETSLRFSYQAIAAASIYIMTDFKQVLHSPPVEENTEILLECVRWMTPFAEAIRERSSPRKSLANCDYTLQTHHIDLPLLEHAQQRVKALQLASVLMTPPPSYGKYSSPQVSSF